MRVIEKIRGKHVPRKDREDMSLSELSKEKKNSKLLFVFIYCIFVIINYLGMILAFDISQFLSMLFVSIMFGVFAIIVGMNYIFTRMIYYLKYNEEF